MKDNVKSISFIDEYSTKLQNALNQIDQDQVLELAENLKSCWFEQRRVWICGNGGSAANAIHLANDFLYGVAKENGLGLKVASLSANPAVVTCLANDIGYGSVYAMQLAVQAQAGDILIVLSGSGNSANIIKVLEQAKKQDIKSYAILGFTGGKAKTLADVAIHFQIDDMQISEDLQIIIGHILMQWLYQNKPKRGLE
ncbi:MAG: SIS domain-containing protein [Methylococcales bacterium]